MRLTNAIREEILNKLLVHKFSQEEQDIKREMMDFALEVYRSALTKEELAWVNSAPKSFRCSIGSGYIRAYFAGQHCLLDVSADSCFAFTDEIASRMRFAADHPFTTTFEKIEQKDRAFRIRRRNAENEAEAVLWSVQTLKKLLEVWPEIEPFCPTPEVKTKTSTAIAIRRDELNNTFGLPIEAEAK